MAWCACCEAEGTLRIFQVHYSGVDLIYRVPRFALASVLSLLEVERYLPQRGVVVLHNPLVSFHDFLRERERVGN